MELIIKATEKGFITSLELTEQINIFRELEGKKSPILHKNMLAIIREEFTNELGELKIQLSSYTTSQNKELPMFVLTLKQAKQVLFRESAYVRRAVVEYIEKLEQELAELKEQALTVGAFECLIGKFENAVSEQLKNVISNFGGALADIANVQREIVKDINLIRMDNAITTERTYELEERTDVAEAAIARLQKQYEEQAGIIEELRKQVANKDEEIEELKQLTQEQLVAIDRILETFSVDVDNKGYRFKHVSEVLKHVFGVQISNHKIAKRLVGTGLVIETDDANNKYMFNGRYCGLGFGIEDSAVHLSVNGVRFLVIRLLGA